MVQHNSVELLLRLTSEWIDINRNRSVSEDADLSARRSAVGESIERELSMCFQKLGFFVSGRICVRMMEEFLPNYRSLTSETQEFENELKLLKQSLETPDEAQYMNVSVINGEDWNKPGLGAFDKAFDRLTLALGAYLQNAPEESWLEEYVEWCFWMVQAWGDYTWGTKHLEEYGLYSKGPSEVFPLTPFLSEQRRLELKRAGEALVARASDYETTKIEEMTWHRIIKGIQQVL